MNTLIIGASGRIGKFFLKSKKKNFYFTYFKTKITKGIKFDLLKNDIEPIIKKYKISKIVFLSAITDPDICEKDKEHSNKLNITKTKEIIDKIIKMNIYLIFISSEFVFSGKVGNYGEKNLPKPINLYGKQKLLIEKYLSNKYKNFSILRIAKTYSDDITDSTLISNYVREILSGKKVFFVSKKQIFSPLYVNDLIKIIYYFLSRKKTGIFNVGGPNSFSRYQVLIKVLKKINENNNFNPQIKIINLNKLKLIAKRPLNVSLNIKKLKRNINFELKNIDFALGIILKKLNAKKFKTR
jgi:dTDP-4-dehydrorhamnose reductase